MSEYVVKAKALNVDLEIEKGATFDPVITFKDANGQPIDNTGWTAKMDIVDPDDPATVHVSLTENSGLVLGGADGTITFNITKTDNLAYTWETGVFDLFLDSGVKTYKIIYGKAKVIPNITTP